jgi:hypothetical protein
MAGSEGVLGLASGAPTRAMPPSGSRSAAMVRSVGRGGQKQALEAWSSQPEAVKRSNAWREHPGTLRSRQWRRRCRQGEGRSRGKRQDPSQSWWQRVEVGTGTGGVTEVTGTKDGLGAEAVRSVERRASDQQVGQQARTGVKVRC